MTELPSWCRVGARVVCVDASPDPFGVRAYLVKNEVYTVIHVYFDAYCLAFAGTDGFGWFAMRFRPCTDTSIESLRALLHPTPDEVRRLKLEDA